MTARLPDLALAVRIREATAADRAAVARLLAGMDRYGLYQRHFAHGEGPNLALLGRLEAADGQRQWVVVAETTDGELIGHGEFVADRGGAEFALLVLPHWRGLGVARNLLHALAERAAIAGHAELRGMIQAGNTAMLRLAQGMGFRRQAVDEPGVVLVSRRLLEPPSMTAILTVPGYRS